MTFRSFFRLERFFMLLFILEFDKVYNVRVQLIKLTLDSYLEYHEVFDQFKHLTCYKRDGRSFPLFCQLEVLSI